MSKDQKTVFISYRRKASEAYARLLFDKLTERGFDVFFDYTSLPAGRYEKIILSQIRARAHFLVLLARGTLPRCKQPEDLLRREIETALKLERNIVPVLIGGFTYNKRYRKQLVDDLAQLADFQSVPLSSLSDRFLKATVDTLQDYLDGAPPVAVTAGPVKDRAAVKRAIKVAASEPPPTREQLSAEDYFNRAFDKHSQGDLEKAIANYTEAIRLNPKSASTYSYRGETRARQGSLEDAIADFSKAIRLDPGLAAAYSNRGEARFALGQHSRARNDFAKALKLDPQNRYALAGMAITHYALGHKRAALTRWRALTRADSHYLAAGWVGKELDWRPELVKAARKLIAEMNA